jgi:hypothetical protein
MELGEGCNDLFERTPDSQPDCVQTIGLGVLGRFDFAGPMSLGSSMLSEYSTR